MAIDMFLKLERIDGESVDDKHKGEIEVLSWSWGATNSGSVRGGGGGGAGKVNVQDLSITKKFDKSSPQLFLRCATGQHIPKATLSVRKSASSAQGAPNPSDDPLVFTLTDVMVSSYQTGVAQGGDAPVDQVSFNFAKIEIAYKTQNADGRLGEVVTACWDIGRNRGCD